MRVLGVMCPAVVICPGFGSSRVLQCDALGCLICILQCAGWCVLLCPGYASCSLLIDVSFCVLAGVSLCVLVGVTLNDCKFMIIYFLWGYWNRHVYFACSENHYHAISLKCFTFALPSF